VNVEKSIEYLDLYHQFIGEVEICTAVHIKFWGILLDSQPDPQKLNGYGKDINGNIKIIRGIYTQIMKIDPNNVIFLYKYVLFLKRVYHDDIEAAVVWDKILSIRQIDAMQNFQRTDDFAYSFQRSGGKSMIIGVSGEKRSLNKILSINFETSYVLNYSKEDVEGVSANILMPPMIANSHDEWILHYTQTLKCKNIGKIHHAFLKTKQGFFIPCKSFFQFVPYIDNGIQFLYFTHPEKPSSFFNLPLNIQHIQREVFTYFLYSFQPAIFLCDKEAKIQGVTAECQKYFNLSSGISKNETHISKLINELISEEQIKKCQDLKGMFFDIKISKLRELSIEIIDDDLSNDRAQFGRISKFITNNK
jgi:hypothetical protein